MQQLLNHNEQLRARHWHWVTDSSAIGMRLDQFLPEQHHEFSRGLWRKIIDLGGVHCAGRRVRHCSHQLKLGETIDVYLDGKPLDPFVLDDSHVLMRDKFILALNKPAGIETQPTPARYRGTIYECLLNYLRDPGRPHVPPEIGMVQRLDRETSGVMVFSIHPRAHQAMTSLFAGRSIEKVYLALVHGVPLSNEGEIVSHLARCRDNRVRSVKRGGKEAITRFRVVARFDDDIALLEVKPVTGRMHQIRAHLSEAGYPILGDIRYGGPDHLHGRTIARHLLHCVCLSFPHPLTGSALRINAPVPEDFLAVTGQQSGFFDEPYDV